LSFLILTFISDELDAQDVHFINSHLRLRVTVDAKKTLVGQQCPSCALHTLKWRKLALWGDAMATTDELAAIVSPYLGELLLIILPDENDDRLRVIDGALEVRIWNGKRGWTYEIASFRSGAVLARGEKSSAYAALERSIPLLLLLHEDSGAMRCAA
jgi:hypothetical protein